MDDLERFKEEQFRKYPGVKKAYDDLAPEFELASQLINARLKKGLSQAELAKKMGTRQSAIARLESVDYNPSFKMLKRVAQATNTHLKVELRP
ncbi:MAG: helix-turn-helix domain-containing protein [Candidatus Berkelbacteria bacterium]|nr:helix-turn-helix domain-containing protein [Candidatus Berkelbacteria bacterium]